MDNSESFRVWNVYPLDSLPFWAIVGAFFAFLVALTLFYRRPERRILMALAILLAPLYMMLIWNLAVNLIQGVDWKIFTAYIVYLLTAQGIMSAGSYLKDATLRWGGWFFLYFTLIHFLFINIWLLPSNFQYSIIALFLAIIFLNRDLLPFNK